MGATNVYTAIQFYSSPTIILLYWVELIMARQRFWTLVIILLAAVIIAGGIVAWQKYSPPHSIEISLPPPPELNGEVNPAELPQKIDINHAEAWLLEALPGIGETKAQAIIAYRQQNGGFGHIIEITNVSGIGPAIYEDIKDLITVDD